MSKRGIVIFTHGDAERLIREISDHVMSRGGRVLYRKTSDKPVFVFTGGEVGHTERV